MGEDPQKAMLWPLCKTKYFFYWYHSFVFEGGGYKGRGQEICSQGYAPVANLLVQSLVVCVLSIKHRPSIVWLLLILWGTQTSVMKCGKDIEIIDSVLIMETIYEIELAWTLYLFYKRDNLHSKNWAQNSILHIKFSTTCILSKHTYSSYILLRIVILI